MNTDELADFLLKNYGERSQLPRDRKKLCTVFYLAQQCKQQLEREKAELEAQYAARKAAANQEFKKNTKK
jgi:hypothetical protein